MCPYRSVLILFVADGCRYRRCSGLFIIPSVSVLRLWHNSKHSKHSGRTIFHWGQCSWSGEVTDNEAREISLQKQRENLPQPTGYRHIAIKKTMLIVFKGGCECGLSAGLVVNAGFDAICYSKVLGESHRLENSFSTRAGPRFHERKRKRLRQTRRCGRSEDHNERPGAQPKNGKTWLISVITLHFDRFANGQRNSNQEFYPVSSQLTIYHTHITGTGMVDMTFYQPWFVGLVLSLYPHPTEHYLSDRRSLLNLRQQSYIGNAAVGDISSLAIPAEKPAVMHPSLNDQNVI